MPDAYNLSGLILRPANFDWIAMTDPAANAETLLQLLCRLIDETISTPEDLLRTLDAIEFALLVTTPRGEECPVIFANQAAAELTGYSVEELLDRDPRFLQTDDGNQGSLTTLRAAVARGIDCRVVVRNYRKDGSLFWNEITLIPIRATDGSLKYFVQLLKDVSNYEKVETEKQTVENTLRSILSSSADAIITIDQRGIIQDANAATEDIFGYSLQELLGQNVSILMPSPDREQHDSYLRRYLETGEARVIGIGREVTARHKTGRTFPAEIAIGQVPGKKLFTGIVRNLTERKQNEEALRREHQLNENIIATSRGVILILSPDGTIVQYNSFLEELSGWPLEETRGEEWADIFLPEADREPFRRRFYAAINGQTVQSFSPVLLTRSGERRLVEWEAVPMTSRTGQIVALLCTGQDTTERQRLEREVLEIAAEEQRRIGQDLHDVVGQELTGMAMLAETLTLALRKDENRHIRIAEKISRGVSEALTKIRLLSRGLNPVDIDTQGLMAALGATARRIREFHGIDCEFQCPETVPIPDNIVANQLYRIVEEATTNAIKHSAASRIIIRLEQSDDAIELAVIDNGVGIQNPRDGGLGLRIMNYRANRIGGILTVESAPEQGTSVTCRIASGNL
ncbi:PAS domain-containing sensor histidine kinase [Rubinisphaera margarita]|uniref:PAS domain-containing sensor histidine kinase n=1 Tax=Rubinisphaera margarita TaxID=2909586 RepID=UPI001EE944AF|nr:PAS domain S-box protein [Rubinisphaera margarita]